MRRSFQIGRDIPAGLPVDGRKLDYDERLRQVRVAISLRAVGKNSRKRQGLSVAQTTELLRVIAQDCPDNPWHTPFAKARNQIIILWLLMTGMRRGELLSRRVKDVQMPLSRVVIVRSPDDKRDPRRKQPLVKTHGRFISLEPDLVALTGRYVSEVRSRIEPARRHGFLFVSKDGAPLSFAALDLLFGIDPVRWTVWQLTSYVLVMTACMSAS